MNYFNKEGQTALRMWIFELAVAHLNEKPHKEKIERLRESLKTYLKNLRSFGSVEDEITAEAFLKQLSEKKHGYVKKGEIGPLEMKSWLIDLAIDELEKTPNAEKLSQLQVWMDVSTYAMMNLNISLKTKFIEQKKRIKAIL